MERRDPLSSGVLGTYLLCLMGNPELHIITSNRVMFRVVEAVTLRSILAGVTDDVIY
jgi:hypothetical protein